MKVHRVARPGPGTKRPFTVADQPRKSKAKPTLAMPEGAHGAVLCPSCDTWIQRGGDGRPVAHAKGGYRVRTTSNRFACPGMEVPEPHQNDRYLQRYDPWLARNAHLVTRRMICKTYRLKDYQVNNLMQLPAAPQPRGVLTVSDRTGVPYLYKAEEVIWFFKTDMRCRQALRARSVR